MRSGKRLGKRGGLASTLVDIYSIFFYVFVLLLFIIIFSLHRCSSSATSLGLTSNQDKTVEARMLLLSLLKGPVVLSDGRTMDIAEMITLNELASEDLEEELEAALTETMAGYFAEAFEEYEDSLSYIRQSWRMEVTYRSDSPHILGTLTPDSLSSQPLYCDQTTTVSGVIPLAYDSAKESQTAMIEFSVCTGLLGIQRGGYSLPLSSQYPTYQGLLGMQWGGT